MKAYFANLPNRTWALIVVPAIIVAYPLVRLVVPVVVHAIVPEVVRSFFSIM